MKSGTNFGQLRIYIKLTARKTLVVNAESEPVREPTDHRCEQCGATFAKAEDLTTHYEAEHSE
jgi:Zn finger protein HypA/HybF involved in hydrogenase expression